VVDQILIIGRKNILNIRAYVCRFHVYVESGCGLLASKWQFAPDDVPFRS